MSEIISLNGKITIDPDNKTKKHNAQGHWKKIAIILFNDDTDQYYSWFIKKRFNLVLNKPIRGPHITFINDSIHDMQKNNNLSVDEINDLWGAFKNKYDNTRIQIELNVVPRFDEKHWWLDTTNETSLILNSIRGEVKLEKPFYGHHMTIGYANEINIRHHNYITNCIKKKLIN